MYRTAIAVADSTRARLFTYGRAGDPAGPHEPLTEIACLISPVRHRKSPGDATDGDPQLAFARSIDRMVEELIDEAAISRLVVCATPGMLQALRGVVRPRHDVVVEELAKSLVELPMDELGAELVAAGSLPA